MLLNVLAQAAQGSEDLAGELVVGAQLDAVGLRDRQGDFQNIDRIQPHALPVQRGGRIDSRGSRLQIERGDDQLGELELFGGERVARQSLLHRGLAHIPCFLASSDRYYSSWIRAVGRAAVSSGRARKSAVDH